jgi:hypothetical protein
MDIPLMIRYIARGDFARAIITIKRTIALPAVLGRICPAPCEKVCRRAQKDQAVSICLLKRFAADIDLDGIEPYSPPSAKPSGKRAAIIGAGPCGLSAAYYLARAGHECTIFEKQDAAGGMLRHSQLTRKLPADVLQREIEQILKLGIHLECGRELGRNLSLAELQSGFDAVLIASGDPTHHGSIDIGAEKQKKYIRASRDTLQTSLPSVFAGGAAAAPRKMAVRSATDGRTAAIAMDQYLKGLPVTSEAYEFNNKLSQLSDEQWQLFCSGADPRTRINPPAESGFIAEEARAEAMRCLSCDCKKKNGCKLRRLSTQHQVRSKSYNGSLRPFERVTVCEKVIYESGKCINCGLCIEFLQKQKSANGLTFSRRGFIMKLTCAFDEGFSAIDPDLALGCVRICPTGAWTLKKE